jgi:hypothetical protein
MPKGEVFTITAKFSLLGINGSSLYNPGTWIVETKMPGVKMIVNSVVAYDAKGDWDGQPELYTDWDATIVPGIYGEGTLPNSSTPAAWPTWVPEYYDQYAQPTGPAGAVPYVTRQNNLMERTGSTLLGLKSLDYDPWSPFSAGDDYLGERSYGPYYRADWFGARPNLVNSQTTPESNTGSVGYNVAFHLY